MRYDITALLVTVTLLSSGCERILGLSEPTLGSDAGICNADLDEDINNCGGCGHRCEQTGGTTNCVGGKCVVAACTPGNDNCNNIGDDGCEASLSAPTSCGACDNQCPAAANATPTCSQSTCSFACASGYLDCTVADGCESATSDTTTCGRCGHDCGGGTCSAGTCSYYEVVAFDYRGGRFFVDDNSIYLNRGQGPPEIVRVDKAGSTPTTLVPGGGAIYGIDATYLYFFATNAKRIPKDGSGAAVDIPNVPADAVFDGNKFYWYVRTTSTTLTLYSAGSTGFPVASLRTINYSSVTGWTGYLSAGGGYIFLMQSGFFTAQHSVNVSVYNASTGSTVSATGSYTNSVEWLDAPSKVVTDGTYYYFGITPNGGSGGTVVRNNIITGASKTLPATAFDTLSVWNGSLFFRDNSGHILGAVNDFTSTSVLATYTAGNPVNVVVDNTAVYWFDATNWPIYRQVF